MTTHPLIKFIDIKKEYGEKHATVHALCGINLSIYKNDFVAIMGPSGSGKSTCMNIIGCLDVQSTGSYLFENIKVENLSNNQQALLRRNYIGFVFQGFNLLNRTSILDNVELPLIYRNIPRSQRQKQALNALDAVGLIDRRNDTPNQLSGGQQQRVAIARAIVTKPLILLADEPTGNLDSKHGNEIMDILTSFNKDLGITVIMVTHDHHMANYAKSQIHFFDGLVQNNSKIKE